MRQHPELLEIPIGSRGTLVFHRRSEPDVNLGVGSLRGGFGEAPREIRDLDPADLGSLRQSLARWGHSFRASPRQFVEQLEREASYGALGAYFVARQDSRIFTVGDVTTYEAIAGLSTDELEPRIGFERGRLSNGYYLYELLDPVGPSEFVWGDDTRYSGGFQNSRRLKEYAESNDPSDIAFFQRVTYRSMRADEMRFALLKRHGFDEKAADAAFDDLMKAELDKLNVRDGPKRIVKVRPVIRHYDPGKAWWDEYPDSDYAGTPQWTLRRVRKPNRPDEPVKGFEFRQLCYVGPREALPES